MTANQVRPGLRWPEQYEAVHNGGSRSRIGVAPKSHRHPEQIARTDKPHNDLSAVRCDLGDAQAPMEQQEKGMCFLVLGKDRRALCVVARMGSRQNIIKRLGSETVEQRKIRNQ